jgi:hypothetical protein
MWLAQTPQALVRAHLDMLPRLQAEEARAAASTAAVGHHLKGGDWVEKRLDLWDSIADGEQRKPARKAAPADLGAIGIGARVVAIRQPAVKEG